MNAICYDNNGRNLHNNQPSWYVFINENKQQLTRQNARQQRAHMTCSVYLHKHDMSL